MSHAFDSCPELALDVQRHGEVSVVVPLDERIDTELAEQLRDALAGLVDTAHERLVLDLSRVQFMDSSGLNAIIATFKRLAGRGTLVICDPSEQVRSLLRLTRLEQVFVVHPDQPSAIRALEP